MRPMVLTIDTVANVCILCGRDDMERREPPPEVVEVLPFKHPKKARTCPGCQRPNLKFTGKCQRCITRTRKGLDLVTGAKL